MLAPAPSPGQFSTSTGGQFSASVNRVFSHVRRKALDQAALALEPEATATVPPRPTRPEQTTRPRRVTSHVTSRQAKLPGKVLKFSEESGAPCTTRTCDLLVRRRKNKR